MKRTFIVISILVVAAVLFFVFKPNTQNTEMTQQTPVELPVAGSTGQGNTPLPVGRSPSGQTTLPTVTIGTHGGTAVVQDFMHNGETWKDIENSGSYVLAGATGYCLVDGTCPHGASTNDFSVSYDSSGSFFNVVLLKEPLGSIRVAAEQFLENRLGLSEQDMCVLNYFVGTTYYVNQTFSGKNLGFSFCPGATKLPK